MLEFISGLDSFPKQTFPNKEFGEVPITLVGGERFVLDIYLWTKADTSIHDHHFCGAFKVFKGFSDHKIFEFNDIESVLPHIDMGKMKCIHSQRISAGHVQKIELSEKFIHQVVHLDHPTVTLCLRTLPLEDDLHSYLLNCFRMKYRKNQMEMFQIAQQVLWTKIKFKQKDELECGYLDIINSVNLRSLINVLVEPYPFTTVNSDFQELAQKHLGDKYEWFNNFLNSIQHMRTLHKKVEFLKAAK